MPSVSDFLIERMENSGIRHVFGVPGCCVAGFFKKLTARQDIGIVHTVSEENAAFAADAYARMRGIGCVCVSQKSILKIANSIACAKEERSPVVVISGAPCVKNRTYHQKIFDYLTCESVVLDNPSTAGYQIDAAF